MKQTVPNRKLLAEEYKHFLSEHGLASTPSVQLDSNSYNQLLEAAIRAEGGSDISNRISELLLAGIRDLGLNEREVNFNQAIITEQSETIETHIRAESGGAEKLGEIFAGEFPTGEINAMAVQVQSGFLALVNIGLVDFISQMSMILISQGFGYGYGKGSKKNTDEVQPADRQTVDLVHLIVADYLELDVQRPAINIADYRCSLTGSIFYSGSKNACLRFVLAHEYGHILAGHFSKNFSKRMLATKVGDIEVVNKSWEQEYEADKYGLLLLLEVRDRQDFDRRYRNRDERRASAAVLAAPFFFLLLEQLITSSMKASGRFRLPDPSRSSHPPSSERADRLLSVAIDLVPKDFDYFTIARSAQQWFLDLGNQVVERIANS